MSNQFDAPRARSELSDIDLGLAPPEADEEIEVVVESSVDPGAADPSPLSEILRDMGATYREDPTAAVRSQAFIQLLHGHLRDQLEARLTRFARRTRQIVVVNEAKLLGSTKPKDVDVAVIDPQNGPLVIIGLRSQMSSVGKNVLNYYEGIVGECISLQQRFPMSTHGYIYLHPLTSIMSGRERESIDHKRFARMYAAVTGRSGVDYKNQRGIFDHFAYMVVDFESDPPTVRDDIVRDAVPDLDMSIATFTDRVVDTFKARLLFWDIFD